MKIKPTIPLIIAGITASSLVSAHTITRGHMVVDFDEIKMKADSSVDFAEFFDKQNVTDRYWAGQGDTNLIPVNIDPSAPHAAPIGGHVYEYYGATAPAALAYTLPIRLTQP